MNALPDRRPPRSTARRPFPRLQHLVAGLLLILPPLRGSAQYATDRTIYLSAAYSEGQVGTGPRGTQGSGTLAKPYYGDFDHILGTLVPAVTNDAGGTTVVLLPGTYWTRGYNISRTEGTALPRGTRLVGSGMEATTIRLTLPPGVQSGSWAVVHGARSRTGAADGDGIEVTDLTVDGASPGASFNGKINGVNLSGNGCAIRRVRATRVSGNNRASNPNDAECFALLIATDDYIMKPGAFRDFGSVIEDCVVTNVLGTYTTAIQIAGQGVVRNNRVWFPIVADSPLGGSVHLFAYNVGDGHDLLLQGNFAEGGTVGFYNDWHTLTNVTVLHNTFRNGVQGVFINSSDHIDTLRIEGNLIELHPWADAASPPVSVDGILVHQQRREKTIRGLHILNNIIRWSDGRTVVGASTSTRWKRALGVYGVPGSIQDARIVGNVIDRNLDYLNSLGDGTRFAGPRRAVIHDNVDLSGSPIPFLSRQEVGPRDPAAAVVSGYFRTVVVRRPAGGSLTLPPAAGESGREFQILSHATNAVSLLPSPGDTIQPRPATVPPGGMTRLVSDGMGTWFRP
jgi:hypothetical protein